MRRNLHDYMAHTHQAGHCHSMQLIDQIQQALTACAIPNFSSQTSSMRLPHRAQQSEVNARQVAGTL